MTERPAAPVKLSLPLVSYSRHQFGSLLIFSLQKYQQDLFNELRNEDELVILARGLGLLRIVTNLLHAFDAAGNNLIIVVGADDRENEWIGEGTALIHRRLKLTNTYLFDKPLRSTMRSASLLWQED